MGGPWAGRGGGGPPPAPRGWRWAERESAGLHSRSRGLRRDLCGRKGAGETRLSRICLMQRFLHIPEHLAPLRREPGWGVGGWRWGSRDAPAVRRCGLRCWDTTLRGGRRFLMSPVQGALFPRLGGTKPGAAPGALVARLVQALPSVGRAGGRSRHNPRAVAPVGSGGKRGTAGMQGSARWRGSAGLSTVAKPPRAWPLPAARASRTPLPPSVPAGGFPGCAAPSAHTGAIFVAGWFGKFYFPCFPYGETEAGVKAP